MMDEAVEVMLELVDVDHPEAHAGLGFTVEPQLSDVALAGAFDRQDSGIAERELIDLVGLAHLAAGVDEQHLGCHLLAGLGLEPRTEPTARTVRQTFRTCRSRGAGS